MVAQVRSWWMKHPVLGWGAIAVLALALVVGAFVLPAMADVVTLVPMQDVQTTSWTQVGGTATTFWSTIDENPSDDNTSYISSATNNARALFEITDPTGLSGTIDSVQITLRVRERTSESGTLIYPVISDGTNTVTGTGFNVVYSAAGTYYSYTDTFATNPAGGAWTWADLASLRAGCQLASASTNLHRVSAVHVTVTYTPDTTPPTVNTTDPTNNAVLTGTSKTISGTADDGTGSGVASVQVQIARSTGGYWNGTDWTGTSGTWMTATGTTNWTYDWSLDAGQDNGPATYTITARATDNSSNVGTDATPVTGVKVDNVGPTIVSATAIDSTHVDVVFSEVLNGTSIDVADFNPITGAPNLNVTAAVLDGTDPTLVHLTTDPQTAQTYTVTCAAGNVLDANGNVNTLTSTTFAGVSSTTLTVTQGSDGGRPSAKVYSVGSTDKVVDELSLVATGGTMTLTQVVVNGLDTTPANLGTDVTGAKLYRDNGATAGQLDGTDSQLGTTQTFSGSTATFSGLSLAIPAGTTEKVWIVYTIGASAVDADIVGSQVNVGDVTATGGTVTQAANIVSAASGQTIQVDATAPTANTSDPLDSAVLTGTSKTISGSADDGTGSGVASVQVQIARSTGGYWTGADWTGTSATWLTATGTTSWTYGWSLDAGQNNGPATYTITARATDNVGLVGVDATPVTGVKVDNVGPAITSATAINATTVDVVFSEPLQSASIAATDFTITGLSVSGAALQADNVTVRLTTSSQTPGSSYPVDISGAAQIINDPAGNPDTNTTGITFTGYGVADTVGPTVVSATAVDATHYDVLFSEDVRATGIVASGFSTAPSLGIPSSAVRDATNFRLVHVTTPTAQTSGQSYTLTVTAGSVLDIAGNGSTTPPTAIFAGYTPPPDTTDPSIPTGVTATSGAASPTIASVSWTASTDNVGVVGYRIYRSVTDTWATGTWEFIGTSAGSPFADTTGVPGQDYWYKVSAYDAAGNESALSASSTPAVRATWVLAPHATYNSSTNLCKMCHEPHVAASATNILRPTGSTPPETGVCYACHDGSGAVANVKTGATNSFALAPTNLSGHLMSPEDATSDLTDSCAKCHNPHKDSATTSPLPKSTINNIAVTGADNTWCLACHDAANSWYGAGYPSSASPTVDATGYPTLGTFPTTSSPTPSIAYSNATYNAHLAIPATPGIQREAGDCLYCHGPHRTASNYDGLVAAFRPVTDSTLADDQANGTYAEVCFKCHGNNDYGFTPAATNIKQYVTAGGERSGHRIKTANATYPVGAPLPCYECHNPHGSARGNQRMLSDSLGGSLETNTAAGVRRTCFTCHTTADTAAGWDSATSAYTVAVAAGKEIAGLPRDAAVGANLLRLPIVVGHNTADAQSCYICHGADYAAGGLNVHNPSGGVSAGGVDCYACHTDYQTYMEDGVNTGGPTKVGSSRTTVYHHVMGSATNDGDKAFAAGSYPTSTTDVYCMSCHVDHDKFNSAKASNLRPDITTVNPAGAATDYDSTSNAGVCTKCHAASLTKDTTNQLSDGSTATPKIVEGAGANQFGASAHDYYATSSYDAATFSANCSKCHNDEDSPAYKLFQTSTTKFGTHWSAERRLLSALGGTVTDPLSETHCYGCHTGGTAGNDKYGAATMTQAARSTQAQFALTSKHPVTGSSATSVVECANCHNPHVVTSTTGKVTDPANTYNTIAYATTSDKVTYCLKCHSATASLPSYTVNGTTYVPSTVTIAAADQTLMNKSTNGARGHWSLADQTGGFTAPVACADCHDNHGSNVARLLGAYDPATGTSKINGATITTNDNTVCAACHTSATGTSYTRLANGYPDTGTWPGTTVYNTGYNATAHTGSFHNTAATVWTGTTYAGGDCKNCHDVHGTANTYDELRGTFTNANFGNCFECHDGAPSTDNIKQYYPEVNGGPTGQANTASTNFGHKIQTAGGTITVGNGLPCYDCHNPHGSSAVYGLQVETSIAGVKYQLGDGASEIDMSSAAGVRLFCFTCHTGDTSSSSTVIQGTSSSGTGFVTINPATDYVEGIDRTSYDSGAKTGLHLPALNGHYTTLGTQGSCYSCHGQDYSGAATNNVHNPGPGVSTGGTDCYVCHDTYRTYMEDGTGTEQGGVTERVSVYHHVMGSATNDGDRAFAAGSYPTSTTDVYCMSCHVDHDKFNSAKASNLRPDITTVNPAGAATDYNSASNTGVCTSCHTTSLTKQVGTDQKDDGSTATPIVAAGAGANQFGASAHDYSATSSYGAATFSANCSKCHNDEDSPAYKSFQTSTTKFGTHWSAARRILSSLGGTVVDPLAESHCYRCHSRTTDAIGGTVKTVAQRDYYNAIAMVPAAERVYAQFQLASSHPVVADAAGSVECESCHNAHVVNTTTGRVTDPDNTYNTVGYGNDANQVTFCLKCHDGTLPAYQVNGTTYVPYAVTQANAATLDNKSTYNGAAKAHWDLTGSTAANVTPAYAAVTGPVSCAECHDNHGSSAPKLLGAYDMTDSQNEINGSAVTANDNTVCEKCHYAADTAWPSYGRLANGYPNTGTWPGMTVYRNATNGIHNKAAVVWPAFASRTDDAGGECFQCHDVHGTANTYDELRGTFTQSSFDNCFQCHDGTPSAKNIKQYYPTTNAGDQTQSASSNFGHKIQSSGGTLTVGDGLPCYDCHNPHGTATADGLLVLTMNNSAVTAIGDGAGEIDMSTIAGRRRFCFLCHTTGDATAYGTNPAAPTSDTYIAITTGAGTAVVEGISRTVYNSASKIGLKIPPVNGHYAADLTQDCYTCHGNAYTSATSNNVHNPGPGGSNGGIDCYGCHSTYQTYMEDGIGSKTGGVTERVSVYHHVMGSATYDGDKGFAAGSYPTSTTDVYCLSCHVDHNLFNASKASNLRDNLTNTPGAMATDYAYTGTSNYYASALTQTTGTWANPANSLAAPDDAVASSPDGAAFEGRHSFSLGSVSNIGAASVTVRSKANWSGQVDSSEILYPTSDVALGSWTTRSSGTTNWNLIDDPATAADGDTTYIQAAGTTQYTAGTANPTVPADATDIMVTVVWLLKDGTANTGTNWAQLRVNGTVYGTNVLTQLYNPTSTTTYDTHGTTWARNPVDGTAWTPATVNQINGFGFDASVAGARVTQGYVKITYNSNQIIYPTSDVNLGSWTTRNPTSPATNFDKIDDPAPASSNDGATTYVASSGTNAYVAGTPVPTVPTGATDIMVTVVYTLTDGTANTQTNYPQLRIGGTLYGTSQVTVGTANPNTTGTYNTYAETFVLNPNGNVAWTPAAVNTVNGFAIVTSGTTAMRLTQMFLYVSYQLPTVTVDDTWALQYSVNNGTSWSNITAASTTNETALTDHTLSLTGILTDANKNNFLVRAIRNVVGSADANTTLDWDATSLSITTAGGNGVCLGCHTVALTKDTTNQKVFAAPPSTVTPVLSVADYGVSAHNFAPTSTYGDGTTFGANCSKCHDDEQSSGAFQTSTNIFGTHWSAERRILAAMGITVTDPLAEETECYKCHSLTTAGFKTTTNQDWYGVAAMSATSQAIYGLMSPAQPRHNVGGYTGLHPASPADETRTYLSANKHVECEDCHNVHAAASERHTSSTSYQSATGNLVSGVLKGVSGATPTFSATNWTSPTGYTQQTATKESEICFKCHSGYNTSVTTWGGTGAAAWTDQALEFSPANASYHPVVAALPVARRLASGYLRAAGTAANGQAYGGWAPGDTMYCSDCHAESSAGSLGPHGSAVKWILKGPNQAWPYTTAAANGTSTGTYRTISTVDTNLDTANGTFCRNCHTMYVSSTNHFDSGTSAHGPYRCVDCHIRVPHGGKLPRLMKAEGGTNGLPARYHPDGNNTEGGVAYYLSGYTGAPWGEGSCAVGGTSCYNGHGTTGGSVW